MDVNELKFQELTGSLQRLWKYILKKWWIIALFGLLGGVLGLVYAYMSKPKYTARTTFALEDNGSGLSGALSLAAEFGLSIGGGKDVFAGDNILQIITSRRIIESVLLSVDSGETNKTFMQEWLEVSGKKEGWQNYPRLKNIDFPAGQNRATFSYLQDSVLYLAYKEISKASLVAQRPDKKLNIYEITFTSHNEPFSKRFIEKLLSETTSFYLELRSSRSKQTLQILEDRVAQLRGSVNTTISSRANAQDANVNPAFAKALAPMQRSQVELGMYGGALTELYKNLELARYQYLKDVPLLQLIDEPGYPLEYSRPRKIYSALIGGFLIGFLAVLYFIFFGFLKSDASLSVKRSD